MIIQYQNRTGRICLNSHKKALSAQSNDMLTNEIMPINSPDKLVQLDGCMRESSLEKMAKLPTAFLENGSVTAATSSPLTDGAACNIICSDGYAEENSLNGLAEIVSTAVVGVPSYNGHRAGQLLQESTIKGWNYDG